MGLALRGFLLKRAKQVEGVLKRFDSWRTLPADVSVLLIEHDMDLVFSFANRMTVLVNGTVLTEGEPEVIANDPQVKAVYLGDVAAEVASHRPSALHHAHDPAEAPHG